jgi:hypothetical protein
MRYNNAQGIFGGNHQMSEELDLNNVGETVMWLVRTIRDDSQSGLATEKPKVCKLNDYSEFEMYQLKQAMDGEDRF